MTIFFAWVTTKTVIIQCILHLESQVRGLIENNPGILSFVPDDSLSDIVSASNFKRVDSGNEKYLYLMINIDGMVSVL